MALTDGLLTCWNMERHGKDAHGTLNLTASGTAIANTGVKANRLTWSNWFATNRFWFVADDNTLDFGNTSWTGRVVVSMFRKSTTMGLVTKDSDSADRQWRLEYDQSTDRIRFRIFNDAGTEVANVAADDLGSPQLYSTYDIVFGYDAAGSRAFISINGGTRSFDNATGTPGTGNAQVRVGSFILSSAHQFLWGVVSEVTFWGRELIDAERASLWNSGRLSYYPYVGSRLHTTHQVMAQNSAASWWCLPKMVEHSGKVFFGGVVQGTSVAHVSQYTIATGKTETFPLITWNEQDEHNIPGLLIPTDAPPIVAYCGHNDDGNLRFRKGTVAGDIMSLGSETAVNGAGGKTYSQIYRGASNPNYVIAFTRAGGNAWHYTESTDYGDSWSAFANLFQGAGNLVYIHTRQSVDRIDIHFVGNPINTVIRGVWHCYLDMTDGTLYRTDGTAIGNIAAGPYSETDMTAMFQPEASESMRFFSGFSSDCLIAVWPNADLNAGRFNLFRRSGSSWDKKDLGPTGARIGYETGNYLSGGDFRSRNNLVVAFEAGGVWRLEERVTTDTWNTWTTTEKMRSATHKISRPYWPLGSIVPCCHVTSGMGNSTYVNHRTDAVRVVTFSVPSPATIRAAITADNPAAYWRLNETSGTTAADQTDAHDGTYVGSPLLGIPGAFPSFGTAVEFNGSQFISVADAAGIRFGSGDFAVSAWVRCDVDAQATVAPLNMLGKGSVTGPLDWVFYNDRGALRFRANNGAINLTQAQGYPNIRAGYWHHVAVTRTSGVVRIYLDGVMVESQTGATADISGAKTITIAAGEEGTERLWPGAIDEVALFVGGSLTPERIVTHFDAKLSLEQDNEVPPVPTETAYLAIVRGAQNKRIMAVLLANSVNASTLVTGTPTVEIFNFDRQSVTDGPKPLTLSDGVYSYEHPTNMMVPRQHYYARFSAVIDGESRPLPEMPFIAQ